MANDTIANTINNAADKIQALVQKLLGGSSFNTVYLLVLAAAWLFTGDIYITIFSAITAVGPAARADAALIPLIAAIIIRRQNRILSRAALALAAACYIGLMPSLAT